MLQMHNAQYNARLQVQCLSRSQLGNIRQSEGEGIYLGLQVLRNKIEVRLLQEMHEAQERGLRSRTSLSNVQSKENEDDRQVSMM